MTQNAAAEIDECTPPTVENPELGPDEEWTTFLRWTAFGRAAGWISPTVCDTHVGVPLSEVEELAFDDGDPCVHVIRLYPDAETRLGVEVNHAGFGSH